VLDLPRERARRELFVAAFGANIGVVEPWVTDRLVSLLEEHDLSAGQTLFVAGDPPDHCYFLVEGRLELTRAGHPPQIWGPHSFLGASDALLERPRRHTARALTELRAMRVPSDAWIDLLDDSFAVARTVVASLVDTVAGLEQRLWSTVSAPLAPSTRAHETGAEFDLIDRLAVLAEAPLLRGAGIQTLSDLAGVSSVVPFERDEVLITRGLAPACVFLVLEGEIEAKREAPQVVWRGGPGDIACGTAAFGDAVLAWEARARTRGRALSFRIADWLDLMEVHSEMLRTTLSALSDARDELIERLQGAPT
jgi:CRP-like cAMP-binding protein